MPDKCWTVLSADRSAVSSARALPAIRRHLAATSTLEHAYAVTLMVPAVLMVGAFGLFAVGKKHYPVEHVRALPPKTAAQKAFSFATRSSA